MTKFEAVDFEAVDTKVVALEAKVESLRNEMTVRCRGFQARFARSETTGDGEDG